jgi:hypothetical protein
MKALQLHKFSLKEKELSTGGREVVMSAVEAY